MAHELQTKLVREIADLFGQYRKGDPALVKFGLKCGITFGKLPIGGGIMFSPKVREERFKIADPAYREGHATEMDGFCAAFDRFAAHPAFLAWNGQSPKDGKFDLVKELSEDFTRPTMNIEVITRRRGQEHEEKLSMMFIAFDKEGDVEPYGRIYGRWLM